jgi:hypothetical protein
MANEDNPILWVIGGLSALLGLAFAVGQKNKPGSATTTTVKDTPASAPAPKKSPGCGCGH